MLKFPGSFASDERIINQGWMSCQSFLAKIPLFSRVLFLGLDEGDLWNPVGTSIVAVIGHGALCKTNGTLRYEGFPFLLLSIVGNGAA